jgi:hypothetical protein
MCPLGEGLRGTEAWRPAVNRRGETFRVCSNCSSRRTSRPGVLLPLRVFPGILVPEQISPAALAAGLTCTAVSHRRAGAPGTNGAPNAHLPWRAAPGVRCKCRGAPPEGAATRASWRSCWLSTWRGPRGNYKQGDSRPRRPCR